MPEATERELLLDIFEFFQVPVAHLEGDEEGFHSIDAAGRRFVFDRAGRIGRIVEDGKITYINQDLP